ncbi:MAG: hypothetical protein QOJ66_3501 [Ilumatobacteraceae bacterium]
MNEDEPSSPEQFVETDAPRKQGSCDRNRDHAGRDSGPRGGERVASSAQRTGSEIAGIVKRSRRAQGLPDHVADSDALRRIAQILQIGSVRREASQREDDAGSTSIDSMTNETTSRRSA